MDPDRELATTGELVPPRPNLGPEPWIADSGRSSIVGLTILGLVVLLILVGWRWRVRRSMAGRPRPDIGANPIIKPDLSPRSRLIASVEEVRAVIVADQGPAWASKTTEEIADESLIVDRLGIEEADRLIELFRIGDRAKFAGEVPDEPLEEWEALARHLREHWSAGATSRSIGK